MLNLNDIAMRYEILIKQSWADASTGQVEPDNQAACKAQVEELRQLFRYALLGDVMLRGMAEKPPGADGDSLLMTRLYEVANDLKLPVTV